MGPYSNILHLASVRVHAVSHVRPTLLFLWFSNMWHSFLFKKAPHHSNKADNIDGGTGMKMKKLSWLSLNLPDACMLLHLEEKKKKKKRENLSFWHTDPALFFPHDWWICLKWVIGKVYPKYYQNNAFPQALLHWPTAAMMHGWLQYSMQ